MKKKSHFDFAAYSYACRRTGSDGIGRDCRTGDDSRSILKVS